MGGDKGPSFSLLKLISEITKDNDIKTVNMDDAPQLMRTMVQKIKDLDATRRGLQNEKAEVDPRGRITIPGQFRTLMGMDPGTMLDVFPYPQPDPKGLMLKVKK